ADYLASAEWTGENASPMGDEELDRVMDTMLARTSNKTEEFIRSEQWQRKKRIMGGIALGATVGAVTQNLVPYMDGLFGGESAGAAAPDSVLASADIMPTAGPEFGLSDIYVNPGDGFYNVFDSMSLPEAQWG